MNCIFLYDEEVREINCFNGLFNLFAFQFQNCSVFMKINGHIAIMFSLAIMGKQTLKSLARGLAT